MPTAFLTGGTGFVGGHVARALLDAGWRIRVLARDAARASAGLLRGLDLEVVPGDLSAAVLRGAHLRGSDAIVHVAGLTKARRLADYREVNVAGTERLIAAARDVAPEAMFVLVSSQAAAGPAVGGRPVSAADPARPVSWYGRSKLEAEEAVASRWTGPWHVVRPGVVYGPGDRGLLQYFRMAARGWVPIPAGTTRIQLIGARRAATAIARAAGRRDLAGRRSFLCDPEPISVDALARAIGALSGRARYLRVPSGAVRALGMGETLVEMVTRRSRPFNADKARELLAGDWLCEGGPLSAALDLPPPEPLGASLKAAWDWYAAAGWL
jgi:nucleoside-diphosphate-sugar epimerase